MSNPIHESVLHLHDLFSSYWRCLEDATAPNARDLISIFERCENQYQLLKYTGKALIERISDRTSRKVDILSELLAHFKTLHQHQKQEAKTRLPPQFGPEATGLIDSEKKEQIRVFKMELTRRLHSLPHKIQKKKEDAEIGFQMELKTLNESFRSQYGENDKSLTFIDQKHQAKLALKERFQLEIKRIEQGMQSTRLGYLHVTAVCDQALAGQITTCEEVHAAVLQANLEMVKIKQFSSTF
jgi:hypothetical protein